VFIHSLITDVALYQIASPQDRLCVPLPDHCFYKAVPEVAPTAHFVVRMIDVNYHIAILLIAMSLRPGELFGEAAIHFPPATVTPLTAQASISNAAAELINDVKAKRNIKLDAARIV